MILTQRRIGLVGCVNKKVGVPRVAKDLYVSTLFVGRRSYVERSSDEWWVLSAKHGLVHPDDVLLPYDVTLTKKDRPARRSWSKQVLSAIDQRIQPRRGDVFEIHAGAEYREFGLLDGLRDRGCLVEIPTERMRIGEQLRFYKQAREHRL